MKINTVKKSHRLRNILVALFVVALVATVGVLAYQRSQQTTSTDKTTENVNYSPPTTEQKDAGDRQKEETINPPSVGSDTTSNHLGVSFTAINQSDGVLQIRTLINAVTSGKCTLSLTKDGNTVTKQSDIQAGPSTSTCKGFNVPVNELSAGTWQLKVQVSDGSKSGSATQEYTVQ